MGLKRELRKLYFKLNGSNNRIFVKATADSNGRIHYSYEVNGGWKSVFRRTPFVIDYIVPTGEKLDLTLVPEGVLLIPFLANLLPISWICDAVIEIDEIDKNFYECLELVKKGYEDMYPMVDFKGGLKVKRIVDYSKKVKGSTEPKVAMFFSAGVDSFDTFIRHRNEEVTFLTIWGSDVSFDDHDGWNAMRSRIDFVKSKFDISSIAIKSTFRQSFDEGFLSALVKKTGESWWYGFQHGIGLIGHAAPIAFARELGKLYIASTFSLKVTEKHRCASDPTIDNHVRFANCQTVHDGYDCSRDEKVQNIVDYAMKTGVYFPLHVCWQTAGGLNCSQCEKCSRTILAIYAAGGDPTLFGFDPTKVSKDAVMAECMKFPQRKNFEVYYAPIAAKLRKRYDEKTIASWARWLYEMGEDEVR